MPRYYFHTREGSVFIPDDEGVDFPDLDAAEQEVVIAAAEMARDAFPKGDGHNITVEVRNEYGERVLSVRVTMEIDRVVPSPVAAPSSRA